MQIKMDFFIPSYPRHNRPSSEMQVTANVGEDVEKGDPVFDDEL